MMTFFSLLFVLLSGCSIAAQAHQSYSLPLQKRFTFLNNATSRRSLTSNSFITKVDKIKEFAVNGTGIPDVDFDIGESYAGLLPITARAGSANKLYFWFFPTTNPAAGDEILIWLNGGPGKTPFVRNFQKDRQMI